MRATRTQPDPAARAIDRRAIIEWVLLSVLLALLVGACVLQQWLWRADQAIYDALLAGANRPADEQIVIVAIDDDSLARIGRWPWSRAVHATLIEKLTEAGARGVLVDVLLAEAETRDPKADAALAAALKRNGRTVLPVALDAWGRGWLAESAPIAPLAASAAGVGHIDVELDPDGIARSVYLWAGLGEARYPQLALALLKVTDPARAAPYARHAAPEAPREPNAWMREQWLHIPFVGAPGSFARYSYVDVLSGAVGRAQLADKYVLVGATAIGLGDAYPTPLSGFNRSMAGIEVHANVLDALLAQRSISPVSPRHTALISAVVVALLMLCLLRVSSRAGLLLAIGACAVSLIASATLMKGGVWFAPSSLLAGCVLAYPFWAWRRLESAQRFVDHELRQLQSEPDALGFADAQADRHSPDPLRARLELVRNAARRQRAARRFVADTLDGLPVGVLVADAARHVVLANRRVGVLLHREEAHLRGETLDAVFATLKVSGNTDFAQAFDDLSRAGALLQFECETEAGLQLFVSVIALMSEGRRAGFIASFADTSELRAAQRSREETMRFISHDLRAPLASIVTLLEGGADEATEQAKTSKLSMVGRYARGALELADDLFRLARAEAADPRRFVEIDVVGLMQDAADEVWAAAAQKQIRVAVDTACPWDTLVLGDPALLRRSLTNLLDNAIKYSPRETVVDLRVREEGERIRIEIADHGYGIAPEHLGQLFTRYARFAAPGQPETRGVGLGLVIVKTIIERHGGSIAATSELGQGTTFGIELPRAAV